MNSLRRGVIAVVCVAALGAVLGAVLGTVLAAPGSSAREGMRATPVRHEVQMRAISFTPAELVVAVGDTVEWRNADIVRHNAVRVDLFATADLKPGERGSWVPADTGTFGYRCTIHARMRGKIVVR